MATAPTPQQQMSPAQRAAQAAAMNMAHRRRVLSDGRRVRTKVASVTQANGAYVAGQATVLNIPLNCFGLLTRLFVKITANVQQSAAEIHTRVNLGPSNFLSQILLNDIFNVARVNTSGWHLAHLMAARHAAAPAAAFTTDSPCGFGSNLNVITSPAAVTVAANLFMMYEIPVAYANDDLRGAIFMNTSGATMNLQLTINPNLSVAVGLDATQACYQSSSAALMKVNSYTIDVYQENLDQLPMENGRYVLPMLDLQQQYCLINTTSAGLVVGADFYIPYANGRRYQSTMLMYDNGGALNAGTDVNYFALQTANSSYVFKMDAFVQSLIYGRLLINDDWPKGTYYFGHREDPIETDAYGNMNLIINPSSVAGASSIVANFEYFATTHSLAGAGSMIQN